MRFNKLILTILALATSAFIFVSCDSTDLDLTQDPNFLSPSEADPDFFLNAIQEDFGRVVEEFGEDTQEVTRMLNMFGRNYQNAYAPTNFDAEWIDVYQQILLDIKTMNTIAAERELFTHIAIGQVIEAYSMVMLVDFFGDVPYTEALRGDEGIFNPALDASADIYNASLTLLDSAIANLAKTETALPAQDLFYGGVEDNWLRAANTIKMKIYLNRRLIDSGSSTSFFNIVNSGNYIQTNAQDFQFQYGNSLANPETRHPNYVSDYSPSGAGIYQSNWFMDYMLNDKTDNGQPSHETWDPRIKYYFYRQSSEVPLVDETNIRCTVEPRPPHYVGEVYCRLDSGYWGRDHGDDSGTPPDTQARTAHGVYPVGGLYDASNYGVINNVTLGGSGAGITPILLAAGVDFMIAEMQMVAGNTADARASILSGIQKSFDKVRTFKDLDATASAVAAPSTDLDASYITEVGLLFDAANDDGKMNLLAKEYFVVLYGNGIEAYNFYRRTGQPNDIQPNLEPDPGIFIRSFVYPSNAALRNSNFPQNKQVSTPVFWDNNPDNFVD